MPFFNMVQSLLNFRKLCFRFSTWLIHSYTIPHKLKFVNPKITNISKNIKLTHTCVYVYNEETQKNTKNNHLKPLTFTVFCAIILLDIKSEGDIL